MSDLANSCEYLTTDKLCLAVSESEKAKAARQVRCRNNEKATCCYLCMLVFNCPNPCQFLGNAENESQPIITEQAENKSTPIRNEKTQIEQSKNSTAAFCTLCNVEMSKTRTKFRIDGWEGTPQKLSDDDSKKLGEEVLSAIIFLCPKCGKIEFRADEKLNTNKT